MPESIEVMTWAEEPVLFDRVLSPERYGEILGRAEALSGQWPPECWGKAEQDRYQLLLEVSRLHGVIASLKTPAPPEPVATAEAVEQPAEKVAGVHTTGSGV